MVNNRLWRRRLSHLLTAPTLPAGNVAIQVPGYALQTTRPYGPAIRKTGFCGGLYVLGGIGALELRGADRFST